jgi:hypothetical protein
MSSRLFLSAAALLVAFAFPVKSHAADGVPAHSKWRHARHYHYDHGYFFGPPGGSRFWWQTKPFPYNDQNDYPGHYNNQTFWERVETQRNYPIGY